MKKYIYVLLATALLVSCYKEDKLSVSENVNVELFSFPQGTNSWDKDIEQIYKDHNVKLVYKDFNSTKFNGSWLTGSNDNEFFGTDLTDEQVQFNVKFFKDEIFKYLSPAITKDCFPEYIYMCYDAFRLEKEKKAFPTRLYVSNPGYWISCLEGTLKLDGTTRDSIDLPTTAMLRREARGRIFQRIFCLAIKKGNIKPPKEIMEGGLIDLKTPMRMSGNSVSNSIDLTDPTVKNVVIDDKNLSLNRGIPNGLTSSFFEENLTTTEANKFRFRDFGTLFSIGSQTPEKILWDYINMIMRYDVAELRAGYVYSGSSWSTLPVLIERHPLLYKIRQIVIDYMKKEYNIDLEAIYNGD